MEEPVSQRPSLPHQQWWGPGGRTTLLLASIAVLGFGIHAASGVLTPILFGALFAAATQPATKYLERRLRFPTSLAVATALLLVVVVLVVACGTLFFGFMDVATDLPRYEAAIAELKRDLTHTLARGGLYRVAVLVQRAGEPDVLSTAVTATLDVIPKIVGFATLAGLVTLFGLLERDALVRRLGYDEDASKTFGRVLYDTQRYLGIKSAVSAMTGLCAGLLCAALGVPDAALWGAVAFWLNFIPVVGSLLAAVPPVCIAFVMVSPEVALAIACGYFVINLVLGNLLEPKWQGSSTGLSPLMVVICLAVWAGLLGPLGALLAVPLTMAVKIACAHTRDLRWVSQVLDNDFAPRLSMLPRKGRRRRRAEPGAEGTPPSGDEPAVASEAPPPMMTQSPRVAAGIAQRTRRTR